MKIEWIEAIGGVAGLLTTTAFVPQAYKVYKTKKAESISLYMFIILNLGLLGWITYGILLNQIPIILPNIITFILALYILIVKIRYKKPE